MFPIKDNIRLARVPLVTIALIALNVIAYLLSIRSGGSIVGGPSTSTVMRYAAIPFAITHPGSHCALQTASDAFGNLGSVISCGSVQPAPSAAAPTWLTPFTAMFMHGGLLHIGGNMLFLAIFGPTVEDSLGRVRYVAFYIVGGLVALGAQVAVDPSSAAPTIGASGAIATVLGGYILLYPRARVLTIVLIVFFFTIIELPAVVLLGFWFAEQLYFTLAHMSDPIGGAGGVAYAAHVGGFAFGLLAIRWIVVNRRAVPPRRATS